MRITRTAAIASLAAALAFGLSACNVGLADENGEEASDTPPSQDGTTPPDQEDTGEPAATEDEGEEPPPSETANELPEGEPSYVSLPCAPGEDIVIDDPLNTYMYTGDCGSITVTGVGVRFGAESVDDVVINATGTVAVITELGGLTVSGTGNEISWTTLRPGASIIDGGTGTVLDGPGAP